MIRGTSTTKLGVLKIFDATDWKVENAGNGVTSFSSNL